MTAGSVAVPAIVPLKAPGSGTSGSRKWMVDSDTLIELHSTTKDCILFYTTNGSKPDPFKKIGDKTTYQYTEPFTLKPGKGTVKAIAVLRDGTKESSVNTKIFQVDLAEEKSDDNAAETMNTTWEQQVNNGSSSSNDKTERTMFKKVIRYSDEKKASEKISTSNVIQKVLTDSPPLHYADTSKSNKRSDEDAMRCLKCNATRPSDPYARFCHGCSATLPPAPGRIRSPPVPVYLKTFPCEYCNSMIPVDATYCSACDMDVNECQRKKNLDTDICVNCGTKNQNDAIECVVCDEKLSNVTLNKKEASKPSVDFVICPFCARINAADARFCDWCGKTPQPPNKTVPCQRCFAENVIFAQFCCSCGKVMHPASRKQFDETLERGDVAVKTDSGNVLELLSTLSEDDKQNWKKIPFQPISKKRSRNAATQVGEDLTTSMSKLSLKSNGKLSPGKGYWRQQLDHVITHLKVFTQNNIDFRESLSQHLISGLISANVEENSEDSELTVTSKFRIHSDKKLTKKGMKTLQSGETLINALSSSSKLKSNNPDITNSRPSSSRRPSSGRSRPSSATNSRPASASSRPGSARRKKKVTQKSIEKEKIAVKLSKLSDGNLKLLNMIKSVKQLDVEKVEELLDSDDVDINIKDENDIPLLKLCVANKNFDLLSVLITAGVEIDQISGFKGTTALHEAVLIGVSGREAVEILLEKGASPDVKDKKGRTQYDLALELGSESLISKFTKHTSNDLLKDVIKI